MEESCAAVRMLGASALLVATLVASALLPAGAWAYTVVEEESCAPGELLRWRGGPSPWLLNEQGARDLEFDVVEGIFREAFGVWSEPCCSGFTSHYAGTSKRRFHWPIVENVIFFEPEEWPSELGARGNVIGVTLVFRHGCSIPMSLMIFNEIDYTYKATDQGLKQREVDLRWVAAHEVGHWLGLGHSSDPESIMLPRFQRDYVYLGLGQDDVDGVCAIYEGSCDPCETRDDCPAESICREGACVAVECRDTPDCPMGKVCEEGHCEPGCRLQSECAAGELCREGSCVAGFTSCEKHVDCPEGEACVGLRCMPQPTECKTCQQCLMDADCSPHEYCHKSGYPFELGICTQQCRTDRDCVGNTVCMHPQGISASLCLAPSGTNPAAVCRPGYQCAIEEPGPALSCDRLGEPCTGGSLGCGGRSDTCIDLLDGPSCSCTCRSDEECGAGGRCLLDPSTDLPSCFPEESLVACGSTHCVPGERCNEGECVEDRCAWVECAEGERCVEGACVDPEPAPGPKKKKGGGGSSCASAGAGPGAGFALAVGMVALLRRRSGGRG